MIILILTVNLFSCLIRDDYTEFLQWKNNIGSENNERIWGWSEEKDSGSSEKGRRKELRKFVEFAFEGMTIEKKFITVSEREDEEFQQFLVLFLLMTFFSSMPVRCIAILEIRIRTRIIKKIRVKNWRLCGEKANSSINNYLK